MDTTTLIMATLSIDAKDGGPGLGGLPGLYPSAGLEYEIAKGLRHGDVAVQVHSIRLVPKEAA